MEALVASSSASAAATRSSIRAPETRGASCDPTVMSIRISLGEKERRSTVWTTSTP